MISVCLATHNGEKYLAKQLESVIPQLGDNDELLISDDASTDQTLEIIDQYKTKNVRLFKNEFLHPARNFEFLWGKADGSIVVPCDQDDIWLPGKLETVRLYLQNSKKRCLLMNARIIDANGTETGETSFELWRTQSGFYPNLIRNTFMGSSMAFTTDLLATVLPFPANVPMHDWWLGLIAEKTGTVQLIDEPQMLYRIHGENASLQGAGFLRKITWRLALLSAIRKRLKK